MMIVTWLSIIGVYLLCLNLGMGLHRETLIELERIITVLKHLGPTVIAGDFNAHLGLLWGHRGNTTTNIRRVLVGELLERCHLHTVSLNEAHNIHTSQARCRQLLTTF